MAIAVAVTACGSSTRTGAATGSQFASHRGAGHVGVPDTIDPASPVYKQAAAACRSVLAFG